MHGFIKSNLFSFTAQPSNQSPMSLTSDASSPRSYVSPRISTPQTNTVPLKPLMTTPPVSSQQKVSSFWFMPCCNKPLYVILSIAPIYPCANSCMCIIFPNRNKQLEATTWLYFGSAAPAWNLVYFSWRNCYTGFRCCLEILPRHCYSSIFK